jgi:acetyl-CoA acetyltransferase
MADAFIHDHVRTPRDRGKSDGALHGMTPTQLAAQVMSGQSHAVVAGGVESMSRASMGSDGGPGGQPLRALGERFKPTNGLLARAQTGELYYDTAAKATAKAS